MSSLDRETKPQPNHAQRATETVAPTPLINRRPLAAVNAPEVAEAYAVELGYSLVGEQ